MRSAESYMRKNQSTQLNIHQVFHNGTILSFTQSLNHINVFSHVFNHIDRQATMVVICLKLKDGQKAVMVTHVGVYISDF